jgi:hypothetical protein
MVMVQRVYILVVNSVPQKGFDRPRPRCKSKTNNRAKCLDISQVAKTKLYNRYLLFVYKELFYW